MISSIELGVQSSAGVREVLPVSGVESLGAQDLRAGDLVFTRTGGPLFTRVGNVSLSWCTHVGVITHMRAGEWIVAESRVPVVCETPLKDFIRRSEGGRFAVRRVRRALEESEVKLLRNYAAGEMGRIYDTGFNLKSRRTFCSKFARDALNVATGQWVGSEEKFGDLLQRNQTTPLWFWRLWYFGRIPWGRLTVTPAALLRSEALVTVYGSDPLS